MTTIRRLAAILAADVAGYSRLMGADEEGTLERLKAHRRELIDPKITEHRGRIVKTTGDGILIEFPSVVDALRCAAEVQRSMVERNADMPPAKRIEFRVGINLGDIIIDGDDIHGDGVNIAARLEGLADSGGICVSRKVREEVGEKLDVEFEDLGDQSLKNIAQPVRTYRVRFDGDTTFEVTRPMLSLPDKPSIAVLPFQNMSGDPEQEYFADGMVEEIITALSRFRSLFVIARNSSFTYKGRAADVKHVGRELGVRYVLEGSVRRAGNRLRVTSQLIDATTGNHIWADRYDREVADLFAIQDEITERVTGAIEPALLRAEGERAATRNVTNMNAWDLVRRGMWYFHQVTHPTHRQARELFRQAIKLDPLLPEGHAWLSRVSAGLAAYGWSDDPQGDLQEAMNAALKAVQLDEKNPYGQYALAVTSFYSDALEQGIRAAEKAIETSPSFALGHLILGTGRLYSGNASAAIEPLQHGLRLSPYDPQNFNWLRLLAFAFYFSDNREDALRAAIQALKIRPNWQPSLETATVCCVGLNRMEEARAFAAEMQDLHKPKAEIMAPLIAHNPQWADNMSAALSKARIHK